MPSVLSASSTPPYFERSQRPSLSAAWACGMLRAQAMIMAIVCSAADSTLLAGALTTMMPRLVAAFDVDVVDAHAGAADDLAGSSAASITSAVTLVADRTMRPWYGAMRATSSSAVQSMPRSTSKPCSSR